MRVHSLSLPALASSLILALAAQADLKKLDNIATDIYASPREGRLVVRVENAAQILVWDEDRSVLKPAYTPPNTNATYSIRYATSQSGKYLLVRQELRTAPPTDPEYRLFDLSEDEVKPVVIPESRATTLMPLIYPDDSRYLFFSSTLAKENSIFTFPIAEYAFDHARGNPQPTGFYLETVPESDYGTRVADAAVSPDGTRAALLVRPAIVTPARAPIQRRLSPSFSRRPIPGAAPTPVPTPVPTPAPTPVPVAPRFSPSAPVPTPVGGYGMFRNVRIVDIKTGRFEELPTTAPVEGVWWPSDDLLVFKSGDSVRGEGLLRKYQISTQQLTRLTQESSAGEEFSKDGRWLIYSRPPKFRSVGMHRDGRFDPAAVVLVEVATGRKFEFLKATSGVFGEEARSLVLRTEDNTSEKPFVRIDMAPYLDGTAPESVDVRAEAPQGVPLIRLGFTVPRYELPTDKETFDAHIEVQSSEVIRTSFGYVLRLELRNKSDVYLASNGANPLELSCELVDGDDNVVLRHTPYVTRAVSTVTTSWEPGTVRLVTCPLTEYDQHAVPFVLKGKVRYSLYKNEKAFQGEVALP